MRTPEWVAVIVLGLLLTTVIYTSLDSSRQAAEQQKQDLQSCKEKTTDVEWCFRTFYGIK